MVWLLKVVCCVDYEIKGLENIPKDRSGVVLSKHQSTWETFFLQSLFHEAAIILKKELLWVPFFGWGLATIAPIAIDRNNARSAMEQIIDKGKKYLAAGRWILVFPEGTRISVGKTGKYRAGGARLAVAAGCPVVPVAHNAGRFWPRRGFIKIPGTIQVIIGPPIETVNRSPEEVLEQAKGWIEGVMENI
jgi:1-acyl-sn-glycerol-3-phosphate acyltransferase